MSYDLMVFEKAKAPAVYEDFLEWFSKETEWAEDRDYNFTAGTEVKLVNWFMAMKETFPPLNGPYSLPDEQAFANTDIEKHLTDYSIGSKIIYASFSWSGVDEADQTALSLAEKHDVGLFNPQTGEILCCDMVVCKLRTEKGHDILATWGKLEHEILTLDDLERGTSHRNAAFITVWFEGNNTDGKFMQCMPDYPKQENFLKRFFKHSENQRSEISSYNVEVGTGEKIYSKLFDSKDAAVEIFKKYYSSQQIPDITDWEDTGII